MFQKELLKTEKTIETFTSSSSDGLSSDENSIDQYDIPKVLRDPSDKQEKHDHGNCSGANKVAMQTFYGERKSHTEY